MNQYEQASPVSGPEQRRTIIAAYVSIAAASILLTLVLSLHVLKPELDPSWRFLSEYQIGRHGWMMVTAFFFMAMSYAALIIAVRPWARGALGTIGALALAATIVGIIIAALNKSDPITVDPAHASLAGQRHALGAMIGIPLNPIAALLVTYALVRNAEWRGLRKPIIYAAHATWSRFSPL